MLESNQDLLNKSIDYLEHFEGNVEEGLNRYIYPNNKHWHFHNNIGLILHISIYMMVWDTDLQHLMDQLVVDKCLKNYG